MVTFQHQGRLGNVLFEAATAIGYADKHGLEFHMPQETHDRFWAPVYLPHLANPNFNPSLPTYMVYENGHAYQQLEFHEFWRNGNIKLQGYFQSEKYFVHIRDKIISMFNFPWEMMHGFVSLHVRRGDYIELADRHPVVTNEYIRKAISHFNALGFDKFVVMSNGMEWCKHNINEQVYPGNSFTYSEGRTEVEDLVLGSCCEHNIVGNDTFSWWQAWLNRNPNKIVVSHADENHFGPRNKYLDISTYTPESWVKIPFTPIYELSVEDQNALNAYHKSTEK